ncbi:MAG TPA: helix-turn-helix transcriptional regulator, partial [Candidatus Polarisedimenticolia bacterium]|nr:helix-turn-helix transcriptional regulator [Candidatus Polarisedimenticolia bacterium]
MKGRRIERRVTLREFAEKSGIDPGNLSKYERGLLPPPQGDTLHRIARTLGLKVNTEEWEELEDLAAAAAGRIPKDLAQDPAVVS